VAQGNTIPAEFSPRRLSSLSADEERLSGRVTRLLGIKATLYDGIPSTDVDYPNEMGVQKSRFHGVEERRTGGDSGLCWSRLMEQVEGRLTPEGLHG